MLLPRLRSYTNPSSTSFVTANAIKVCRCSLGLLGKEASCKLRPFQKLAFPPVLLLSFIRTVHRPESLEPTAQINLQARAVICAEKQQRHLSHQHPRLTNNTTPVDLKTSYISLFLSHTHTRSQFDPLTPLLHLQSAGSTYPKQS